MFASDQTSVPRDIQTRNLIFDQSCTVSYGSLFWKKPLFSLQPHIEIIAELSIYSTRIFHPSMFHLQCNKSCCGEKVLGTNLSIACQTHDIKAKKYVPVNVWRWLSHIYSATLTALACTSLSTWSLNSAACISCLDHKRLQANKLRKSMRTNTTPDMVDSFTFFDTQATCRILRGLSRQTIVSHDQFFMWW